MSTGAIVLIILLGILLLLVEFLIIPGVTIAGIGGFLCIITGIVLAYYFRGATVGHLFLAGTVVLSVITILTAFKLKTWRRFGLDSEIDGKVKPFEEEKIKVGDMGKTITRLNPIGKVMVNDILCEAKSIEGFMDENKEVKIIKVLKTQIVVKLK